eukprot:TRINITY_DN9155_c0_g1_i2.p1 TRINITY_DN9155_c0_g1~~TRINITY_DN9155_c0_g1_i2.p1  ORF type:complete len:308 (+),score=47.84 TRINITY_DN9155_c0_g1_i2:59-982(+)
MSNHLRIKMLNGINLPPADVGGKSDPYVVIQLYGETPVKVKTKTKKSTLNPVWNQEFDLMVDTVGRVDFKIYDKDLTSADDFLGLVTYELDQLQEATPIEVELNLRKRGSIRIELEAVNFDPSSHLHPGYFPISHYFYNKKKNLVLQDKKWSFSGKMIIEDEETGQGIFRVQPKRLAWGHQIRILDMSDTPLIYIKQKGSFLGSKFSLYLHNRGGPLICKIKQKLSFTKNQFVVNTVDGREIELVGSWLNRDFKFFENGIKVGSVSKKGYFTNTDKYKMKIAAGADTLLQLACMVIIDKLIEDQRRN